MTLATVPRALHAQTWKLAQSAEIEISLFSRQCLGKRGIADITTLRRQTKAWNRRTNRDHITIRWIAHQKTSEPENELLIYAVKVLVA
jgi:hypothetical protein